MAPNNVSVEHVKFTLFLLAAMAPILQLSGQQLACVEHAHSEEIAQEVIADVRVARTIREDNSTGTMHQLPNDALSPQKRHTTGQENILCLQSAHHILVWATQCTIDKIFVFQKLARGGIAQQDFSACVTVFLGQILLRQVATDVNQHIRRA